MPVDASIPLGIKPPQLLTPMEAQSNAMSLQHQIQQATLADQQIQQGQNALRDQQFLAQLAADPTNMDPATGTFNREAINKAAAVNPMLAQKLNANRLDTIKTAAEIDWKTSETAKVDEARKSKTVNDIMERAYAEYDANRANPEMAAQKMREAMNTGFAEAAATGAGGFTPKQIDALRAKWLAASPEVIGNTLTTHKERMDLEARETPPIGKEAAYAESLRRKLADLPPGDPAAVGLHRQITEVEKHIAKLDAPARTTINTGDAESAKLQPEETTFMARQALAGDNSVLTNIGRGKQGAANIVALRREMMKIAKDEGISPEELAMKNAEFFGIKAGERTLGTRQANISLAANTLEQFIPLADAASDAYKRTGVKSLNDLQKFAQGKTASPELRKLAGATNAVINAYARAVSPSGTPSISDKDHAREVLDVAFSNGDFHAATEQLMLEIGAEKKAPGAVREAMREGIVGKKGKPDTAAAPSGVPTGSKQIGHTPDGKPVWQSPDGKKWVP